MMTTTSSKLPISEWLFVFEDDAPKLVRQYGETEIGSGSGWTCVASLTTEERAVKRVDVLWVALRKGDVEFLTRGYFVEGEVPAQYAPMQISEGPERKPVVTIAFASRAVP